MSEDVKADVKADVMAAVGKMLLPDELADVVKRGGAEVIMPETREELFEWALNGGISGVSGNSEYEVAFDVPNKGRVVEARVTKCKNGLAVNFPEPYMRRRDPDSMIIADDLPTDKARHKDVFGVGFDGVRRETMEWLKEQERLLIMPFMSGGDAADFGCPSLLVAPANAAFFAAALADMQGYVPRSKVAEGFAPEVVLYVAPPFRHTDYNGKQYVVHNRKNAKKGKNAKNDKTAKNERGRLHEIFSYNLYPGPSAKKGVYSALLNIGENAEKRWLTAHAATVRLITPYEMSFVIMHEGASGGGKSEMLERFGREPDGRVKLGHNIVTGDDQYITIVDECELNPVTDDMALCHPSIQNGSKLAVMDAEDGWFLRVNHIERYGTAREIEYNTIHPSKPLIFLNIDAAPNSTCLIWEPVEDAPGKPCPNPRVIMPRSFFPDLVDGAVEVDVRSFGLRQPPTTLEGGGYGIAGLFHVLPPALAWLWRLVAPRGYANPSVIDADDDMQSEGVGSYWPFATGKMVDQANMILEQILATPSTRYVLIPNQHIGVYNVGFTGQWVTREYLARRGGTKFKPDALQPSRCPLLGYSPKEVRINGANIPHIFLRTYHQQVLGIEGYDKGAAILTAFFKRELKKFLSDSLMPQGRAIIEACLNDAGVEDYYNLIPKL